MTERARRVIRPPDRTIKGRTLMYGPYRSAEATRRYIHLAFRDALTALDLTVGSGGFWRRRIPPGLTVTTNNVNPKSAADLHVDFTATGLADESYDLVIYDPPHLADLGAGSIMRPRFGTAPGTDGLDALVIAGVREAWRLARVGILVKLADSSHGGEYLQLSRWVADQFDVRPYFVAHTTRPPIEDGKWKVQRVPRSNGAVYLVWRKSGHDHVDFDRLFERQERRAALRFAAQTARDSDRQNSPKRCSNCNARLAPTRHRQTATCSSRCRQQAYRRRLKGAPGGRETIDGGRSRAVGQALARSGIRDAGSGTLLARRLRGRIHSGVTGARQPELVPSRATGVAP